MAPTTPSTPTTPSRRSSRTRLWRSWSAGLTTRASCLLAAGLTAALCGLLLGETDLVRAGVLAAAIPLVAGVVVRRSQVNIASRRSVEINRATAGTPITVSISVTNRSLLPTGALMMQDTLPSQVSGDARFVLDGLTGRESRSVSYRIPGLGRGNYVVGPLRLRLSDPFRMADLTRSFTATSVFVLTPVVEPLSGPGLPRSWDAGENAGSHSIGSHGADDASTREYRRGDDLRKIHWRTSARTGVLMVRHEERPWQGHTTLLLDIRAGAHASEIATGSVPGRSDRSTLTSDPRQRDSLEWAISCTASIGVHLLSRGREVNLVTGPGASRHTAPDAGGLLDALAALESTNERDLGSVLGPVRAAGTDATLIAVLGQLDAASLRMLSQLHPRGAAVPAFAVLLDPTSWRSRQSEDPAWASAAALLRASGWWVAQARRGDDIAAVWAALVGQRLGRSAVGAAPAPPVSR